MAKYDDIINELRVVAEAFTSVNYFVYDRVSSVNGRLKDKAYPMILVNSSPNNVRGVSNNSYLPKKKQFIFNIFCYDDFNKKEQETTSLEEKQATVDNILDQYIAELIGRNIEGENGFSIIQNATLTGFLAHDVHNDKLVQSTYTLTIELDSDCVTGTFNY